VSALVGRGFPVAVSPGLLDELLDPALAKPFEGGKVRFPVWDVAQAPGEPDGILHRQRGALPRARLRRVCCVPDQAHRARVPAGQRGHIAAWPASYRTVVEANDLCDRSVVVGVHLEQLPAPPLVRYGLKLLPFRLDRLPGVLEPVDQAPDRLDGVFEELEDL
jgi:hypothetical protein